jgi:hypothetical protein
MFNLTRSDFPDLLWGADELDDVAQLWLTWHDHARGADPDRGFHGVCLRLWGFPRHDGAALAARLEDKLTAADLDAEVNLEDPDYLTVTTPFERATDPCRLGRWLTIVKDRGFDNLVLFIEFSVHDWPGAPEDGPASAGGTIVLCGQLRQTGFLLKGAWPVGIEPGIENLYRLTVWPDQPRFLDALEMFRSGALPPAPENYFAPRSAQRFANSIAQLIIHVPGSESVRAGRLSSFLFRTAFHLSALLALTIVFLLAPPYAPLIVLLSVLVGVFAVALCIVVWWEAKRIWSLYHRMKAAMKRIYTRPLDHRRVTLADFGIADDPNVAKYSRELEAAGCRHLGDVSHVHGHDSASKNLFRIFVNDEAHTYVFLMAMVTTGKFLKFPVHVHFLLRTQLADGRVFTIDEGGGYRGSLVPDIFIRRFPELHDPATLLAKHRKFVAEICARGHTLAPLVDLAELLERQKREHEEICPTMEAWGYYSWAAAFRQSFGLVRKEYLEPEDDGQAKKGSDPSHRDGVS